MNENQKFIIKQFRYSLKENGKALVKYLQSIDYNDEKELKEAMTLFK